MTVPFTIAACCQSDPGKRRSANEDTCLADQHTGCYLVADGMGGAAAGGKASTIFADTARAIFSGSDAGEQDDDMIDRCFQAAHDAIRKHIASHPEDAGMGCTAELLAFGAAGFILGHVGDSRTYRLRDRSLDQLTRDHSLIQDQLDRGLLSPAEARTHRLRNVILRAVGSRDPLEVDILRGEARRGDLFLLCSDGLHGVVEAGEIAKVLNFSGPLPLRAAMLIDLANNAGGPDNIAVTLIELG